MKLVAVSGIADKDNVLIPMGETFDDSRLTKEVRTRFLKLKAIKKPDEFEADIEEIEEVNQPHTQKSLMEKSIEELTDIAKGLQMPVPEKPSKANLTKLILGETE